MTQEPLPNRTQGLPEERYYNPNVDDNWADILHDALEEISNHAVVSSNSRGDFEPNEGTLFVPESGDGTLYIGTGSEWLPIGLDNHVTQSDLDTHTGSTDNPHTVSLEQARAVDNTVQGNIDIGTNRLVGNTSNAQMLDVAVDADAYTQFARFTLAGYGDIAWGPNNETSRGNALTIYDYALGQYLFSVQLDGEGVDVHQGDLNVENGAATANTVTAENAMNVPVHSGSDPSEGNFWIRSDR